MRLFTRSALLTLTLLPALLPTALAQEPPPMKAGTLAPAFTTKTVDGKPLTLKSLRGKVVLMDVWATWCGPCRQVTPILEALHRKYGSKGLVVIGLSVDDSGSSNQVKPFQKANKLTYTLAVSPEANAKIAQAYHVEALPSMFLIDQKGITRWSHLGINPNLQAEAKELDQRVSELLDKPATPANKVALARKK